MKIFTLFFVLDRRVSYIFNKTIMLSETQKDSSGKLAFSVGENGVVNGSERDDIPVALDNKSSDMVVDDDVDESNFNFVVGGEKTTGDGGGIDALVENSNTPTVEWSLSDGEIADIDDVPEVTIDMDSQEPSIATSLKDFNDDEPSTIPEENDVKNLVIPQFDFETEENENTKGVVTEKLDENKNFELDKKLQSVVDEIAMVSEIVCSDGAVVEKKHFDDDRDTLNAVDETVFGSSDELETNPSELNIDAFDLIQAESVCKEVEDSSEHEKFSDDGNDNEWVDGTTDNSFEEFNFGDQVNHVVDFKDDEIDSDSYKDSVVQNNNQEKEVCAKAQNTTMNNIKTTVIASLVSAVVVAGTMLSIYEFGVKGDINSKVDESSYTQQMKTMSTKVESLEKTIASQDAKFKSYATSSDLSGLSDKISVLVNKVDSSTEETSIKEVETKIAELSKQQQISKETLNALSDKLEWSIAKISSSNSNSSDYKQALKYIVSLKKLVDKSNRTTMVKIGKISKDLSSSIDKVRVDLGENKKVISGLRKQLDITQKNLNAKINSISYGGAATGTNSQTLSGALGINVDKSASKPVYRLRGIFNGTLFVDMPKAGTGESQVTAKKVGDYLDGYGRILSINPSTKVVRTEGGVVNLSQPSA
ncbi:hypothetical protein [Photobacterium damselae]|uniref:hypothetical protein n=1 Tax=Photobacterium damselae TaxID=38293 RepID=UPI001F238D90|nr:hypothetical protein [Photobacterium damselae]UKA04718.1 hypothetical protein IHC89_20985 [Photobacterium damselae subsp. damselae]